MVRCWIWIIVFRFCNSWILSYFCEEDSFTGAWILLLPGWWKKSISQLGKIHPQNVWSGSLTFMVLKALKLIGDHWLTSYITAYLCLWEYMFIEDQLIQLLLSLHFSPTKGWLGSLTSWIDVVWSAHRGHWNWWLIHWLMNYKWKSDVWMA